MTLLILKSLSLMLATFVLFAWLGWNLARRAHSYHSAFERPSPVFFEMPEVVEAATPADELTEEAPMAVPASPVSYLDAAAEAFTSGVVVPFKAPETEKAADKAPYTPLQSAPRFETAAGAVTGPTASNVFIHHEGYSLQRSASSLASMTPESVHVAVQQAGTGLEPIRVGVPQSAPDDLTVISGIDAGRQKELNGLGIFYYWQVAGWSPENVAWMANRILSPERMVRENWMSQAARLAKLS